MNYFLYYKSRYNGNGYVKDLIQRKEIRTNILLIIEEFGVQK